MSIWEWIGVAYLTVGNVYVCVKMWLNWHHVASLREINWIHLPLLILSWPILAYDDYMRRDSMMGDW